MNLFDSHCHLDFDPLSTELEDVIERAYKNGVTRMLNVGASFRGSERSVEIANKYPNIWASVGLHPHEAETTYDVDMAIEKLRVLAGNDKVVAIGEIGLDYFSATSDKRQVASEVRDKQKNLFTAQLKLAEELKLPVILHIRDAWDDFFTIIQNSKFKTRNSSVSAVVHCFTGDEKIADKLVEMGFYIGFTGFVTFEQSKFEPIRDAAKKVTLNNMLVETDAPFLAPEPYRGKTNEPAYVIEIAKKIAQLKDVTIKEVEDATTKNAEKLFNIK